jgi:serine/threonine protein kinase
MRVTLIDIGLAEEIYDGSGTTSKAAGTFHAMAPEMANLYLKILKDEEVDYQRDLISYESDIFSLGVLMLELMSNGKGVPYGGYFYH